LAYYKSKRDLSKIAVIQNNLGLTEDAFGNYEEAIGWFSNSLELARKNDDFVNTANALSNLGLIHHKLKQYNEAVQYLKEVLQLAQKRLHIGITLTAWLNLGNVYKEKGEVATAASYFEQVLVYSNQTTDTRLKSYAQNNLAEIYLLNKDYAKASSLFEQSLQAKKTQGDKWGQIYSYIGLSEVALQQGLLQQALAYGRQGLTLAQAIGAKKEMILALQQMTKLYKANGKLAEALNTSELTQHYQDSLYNEQNLQRLLKLKTKRSQDKQLLENKLSQEERKNQLLENERNVAGINTRNWILLAISFILLLAIGLILLLYKYYHAKHNAFIELKRLHEEIALQQEKLAVSNEALEKTVTERTASLALQNQKLEEYAFFNAHQVRRPLANILGLAYLLEKENNLDNIYIYVNLMYQSAKELDEIVKQLNDLLTSDDFTHVV
jgi:tetratricopeptide (TPR) repeat protein